MKLFPKQQKGKPNTYYYGDWGEIPAGFSVVNFEEFDQTFEDGKHLHEVATEFYLVTRGSILVEVNGRDIEVSSEQLLMVEPKEPHLVKSVLEFPCTWISFAFPKGEKTDKVSI